MHFACWRAYQRPTGHPALPGGLFCAIGNPLSDGTWTYEWINGRQLQKMQKSGETVEFVYNENGLRIQKVATSTGTTNYTLHGKNIVHMTQGSNSLHFFYDASNKPAIVEFNGEKYAYVHNLQGDIAAILDSNGTAVVQYKYDAWGKPISKTGSMKDNLGNLNPFRYRGYVYDEETGLYYLRSRYYDSSVCRFVNQDIITLGNMYAYCHNNPISFEDAIGTEATDSTSIQSTEYGGMANCYAYAFRLSIDPRTNAVFTAKPQPGEFAFPDRDKHSWYWEGDVSEIKHNLLEAVAADGEVLGFTITEVNSCDSEIPEGSWMVALGLSYHCPSWNIFKLFPHMYDYHWWRKDEDGTWSHKLGANPISYTDNDGSPIYDPENCSRAPYEYILAYLIVTPTN